MRRRSIASALLLLAACGTDSESETGPAFTGTDGSPTSGHDDDEAQTDDDEAPPDDDDDGPGTTTTTTSATTEASAESSGSTETGSDTTLDPGPAGSCGAGGGTGEILQIELGSPERWYLIGAHETDEPLPLVVAFHGDEGDPFNSTRYIWGSYWEQEQPPFIAVMTKCPGCESWYQGDTDAKADYVWEVLADVAANHNVDVSRIYAVGYSGGSEFLAIHGWEFQDVFAGIQFSCGGNAYTPYSPPSRDDCKVAGRIVISQDDFLYDGAQALLARLQTEGHQVEYVDAQCSGHCCDTPDQNEGAWAWFQTVTKCDAIVPGECTELETLPPSPSLWDPGSHLGTAAAPGGASRTRVRAAVTPSSPDFEAALREFDGTLDELERAAATSSANSVRLGPPSDLVRAATGAYDRMLAAAHAHGPTAKAALRARYPRLRAILRAHQQPAL